MIKRILLALADTQYATATIRRAVELALLHEAEITAVAAKPLCSRCCVKG